jgi:hypothetical protein
MPLTRQVRIASRVVPARWRFRFALAVSRLQGRMMEAFGGNRALTEAMMRDHWLRELTFHGAFPVPWRLQGRDVLDRYCVPGPVLYCTTHIPLGEVPLRVVIELGYPTPLPFADPGRIVGQDQYVVAGLPGSIPALPVSGYSLARMRTLLREGRSVVFLADSEFGGELSANPLRLAARLGIPVIFAWAELAADDAIDVTIVPAPHPFCENEAAIEENLQLLREITDRLLHQLGAVDSERAAATVPVLSGSPAPVRRSDS